MFTHAASFFSTSDCASRSATARSGKLVNTNSVFITQSFVHCGMAKPHAEHRLQPAIVEAPRLLHEAEQLRRHERADLLTRHARRSRQARMIGDEVQPLAQA